MSSDLEIDGEFNSPLEVRVREHVSCALAITELDSTEVYTQVADALRQAQEIPVTTFISEINRGSSQLTPIGFDGLRPEGIIFSVETEAEKPRLVKLFNGGLSERDLDPLLRVLYSYSSIRVMGVKLPHLKMTDGVRAERQLLGDLSETASYLSSAEIAVRTMAHVLFPDSNGLPVALTDDGGEPVGFYLSLKTPIALAGDYRRKDTFFDMDPLGTTYPVREDLPAEAVELLTKMEPANILIYDEVVDDHKSQLLLDASGNFVTFAHLGYLFH